MFVAYIKDGLGQYLDQVRPEYKSGAL